MTFREKLIALRARDNLTQTALARAVGVTRQSVYMWEKGQSYPEAETLLALRRLFGVSIDALLDDALSIEGLAPSAKRAAAKKSATSPAAPGTTPQKTAKEEPVLPETAEEPFEATEGKTPSENTSVQEPPAKRAETPAAKAAPLRAKVEPSKREKSGTLFDLFGAFFRKKK